MQPTMITTVTTPAQSYDLTSLAILKDELDITTGQFDDRLQRYLTNASAAAAQYCNRVFPVETIKDLFWVQRDRWPRIIPGGVQALQLSRWPIVAVSSVTENAIALVEDVDFRTDARNGRLIRIDQNGYPKVWPVYPIEVDYSAGFGTVPSDVQDAVIRMVRARWNAKDRDPSLMSENIPGVREARWWIATGVQAGNMTPDMIDLLDNYRVPVVTA